MLPVFEGLNMVALSNLGKSVIAPYAREYIKEKKSKYET